MKKTVQSLSLTLLFSLLVAGTATAQSTTAEERMSEVMIKKEEAKAMRQDAMTKVSDKLQDRAAHEISRRITSLEKLIEKINSFKRLSDAQKSSLTSQVQAEIENLSSLQTTISLNTDPTTLKQEIQSIKTSYRIYALFMPKIMIISAGERILNTADQMNILAEKLEGRITEAEAAGEDVTAWKATLTSMQTNITAAVTQAQAAIDAVLPLTPEGYPDNKTTLQSAREMLSQAHQSLIAAMQDAKTIMQALGQQPRNAGAGMSETEGLGSPTSAVGQ